MNISELFEIIQNKLPNDDINGEYALQGNCIVWEYNLINHSEEIEMPYGDDDEDFTFNFESTSPEELLLEAYQEDKDQVEVLLDQLNEFENWTFSEPDINDNTISFKIF